MQKESTLEFWDEYHRKNESKEWILQPSQALMEFLRLQCPETSTTLRLLEIGCGTSTLAKDLWTYIIDNNEKRMVHMCASDVSRACIQANKERDASFLRNSGGDENNHKLEYRILDVFKPQTGNMDQNSFDTILDKGCLDTFMFRSKNRGGKTDLKLLQTVLNNIWSMMSDDGVYLVISPRSKIKSLRDFNGFQSVTRHVLSSMAKGDLEGKDKSNTPGYIYVCNKNVKYEIGKTPPFGGIEGEELPEQCPSCFITFFDFRKGEVVEGRGKSIWIRQWKGHCLHCKLPPRKIIQKTVMDDFDYVASGGFVIQCQDDNLLGVAKEQAEIVRRESVFFDNCFRHGTLEDQSGVICKPDWPLAVARHIVEVLTKGKTATTSLELLKEIFSAADYACIDLRLCSMVNYIDPALSVHSKDKFLDLVGAEKYCFTWKGNVKSKEWLELLEEDVLLHRKETNFVVQNYKEIMDWDDAIVRAKRELDNKVSEYIVHAHKALEAIIKIEKVIAKVMTMNCGSGPIRQEKFSIYFETSKSIPDSHQDFFDRLKGSGDYIRTCPDASGSKNTEGHNIRGSFDVLIRAIQPLLEEEPHITCALRIDYPTPDTLGRFINACQLAKDFPGKLGMDACAGRYFCRKTARDVKLILEYLGDYSTRAQLDGDFTIFEAASFVKN